MVNEALLYTLILHLFFFFAETMEDYDQDWLNIYNDTEHSSGQGPLLDDIASCDTKTCDEEAEGIAQFRRQIFGY